MGLEQASQCLQRRALAGAVGADDGDDLALGDVEGDVPQRLDGAVRDLQVPHAQHQAASSPR